MDLEVEPVDVGKSKELDFLVLRTKAPVVGPERRFPPMGSDPPLSSDLYMIHQPFGDSLTVSGRECQTTDTKLVGANFGHLCDSVPGSSGAPIFDLAFNIVGIHVAGGKKENGAPNYGLLLSSILSQSGVVRDSLRQYASHTALVPAIPTSSAGREILLADGSALSELNGDWRLLSGDEKNRSSQPLRVQAGSSDEYVLWDPSTDSIYRIPRGAGNIKRKKSGEASWTEFPKGDPS